MVSGGESAGGFVISGLLSVEIVSFSTPFPTLCYFGCLRDVV